MVPGTEPSVDSQASSGLDIGSAPAGPVLLFFFVLWAEARREKDTSLMSLSPSGEGGLSFSPDEQLLARFAFSLQARRIDAVSFFSSAMSWLVTRASLSVRSLVETLES